MNDSKTSEELQIKVAFLEDSLTKLSDEFYRQQREIEDLKVKYEVLVNKLVNDSGETAGVEPILDERPPHY